MSIKVIFQNQSSHSVMSNSLRPHESQHARPPCPSPTPRVYSNSCPLSWWCHPAISSSVFPFSSFPQSLPASASFPMSQLFTSGGWSIGVSASASVLPMNTQDWSPLGCTGWISLQPKGLLRVLSNTNPSECVTVNLWQWREKVTMRSRHLKKENLRPHDVQGKKSHKPTLFFKTILPIAFLLKKTSWTVLPNCDKHLTFNWLLGLPSPERWLSLQFDQQSP